MPGVSLWPTGLYSFRQRFGSASRDSDSLALEMLLTGKSNQREVKAASMAEEARTPELRVE